jgi:hypothetical protein
MAAGVVTVLVVAVAVVAARHRTDPRAWVRGVRLLAYMCRMLA